MPTTEAPPLSDLQTWMRWVLTHPHGVGCALRNHRHPLDRCVNVIGQTPEVSREARLSIYGDGYFSRIIDVLGGNYSSVKNVMGAETFEEVARAYLVKHPSSFKSIDDVGAQLSTFLKRRSLSKKFRFLPELAALEWAAHRSFFADNKPGLDPRKFNALPHDQWARARLEIDSSVKLLRMNWLVDDLWRADGKWPASRLRRLKKKAVILMIFRTPEKLVRVRRIDGDQYDLLRHLQNGKSLGQSLRHLSRKRWSRNAEISIGAWFREWTRIGVFQNLRII